VKRYFLIFYLFIICFFGGLVQRVDAICDLRFGSRYDVVVGRAESQNGDIFTFKNLLTVRGQVPAVFNVYSAWRAQNEPITYTNEGIRIPQPPCAGCSPAPYLEVGSTYLMTVFLANYAGAEYKIADSCGNFFYQVEGKYDPLVATYMLRHHFFQMKENVFLVYFLLLRLNYYLFQNELLAKLVTYFLMFTMAFVVVALGWRGARLVRRAIANLYK
jgi:hypothetical protein